jgi:hypothetical protein
MSTPQNTLQQVITYQNLELAYLLNISCFVTTANLSLNNFQTFGGNLGDSVSYQLPYRLVNQNNLVSNPQSTVQRRRTLTVDQQISNPYAFTMQQKIFNMNEEDYMRYLGKGAMAEMSTEIERFVAGLSRTIPYRFFGDGRTQLNSITQVNNMIAKYKNYGLAMNHDLKIYWPITVTPDIASSAMNQFVPKRNEDYAMDWKVADYNGNRFYESNLLPTQFAGTVGNADTTLTVVSTNDVTGNNITQITFSGASASDSNAIKQFDSLYCSLSTNNFLTFVGHVNNGNIDLQIQATEDAGSDGSGNVTVNITPALCAQPGNQNQNIAKNIVAGMQFKVLPDHQCGMIVGGDSLYFAMPQLPNYEPWASSNEKDEDTGLSFLLYYGGIPGQNELAYWHNAIYGADAVPEYCMKIVIPLNS